MFILYSWVLHYSIHLYSSLFTFVHLYSSLFIFVHLCSSMSQASNQFLPLKIQASAPTGDVCRTFLRSSGVSCCSCNAGGVLCRSAAASGGFSAWGEGEPMEVLMMGKSAINSTDRNNNCNDCNDGCNKWWLYWLSITKTSLRPKPGIMGLYMYVGDHRNIWLISG